MNHPSSATGNELKSVTDDKSRQLQLELVQILWKADIAGEITFMERQWQHYTGLSDSKLSSFFEGFHPEERDRVSNQWRESVVKQQSFAIRVRLRQADGCYHPFIVRAEPVSDPNGKVFEWVGTCTQVRQPQAEPQLFQEVLLDHLCEGIIACSDRGVVTFNRRAADWCGLEQSISVEQWFQTYPFYWSDQTPMLPEDTPLYRALQGENLQDVEILMASGQGFRTLLANGNPIVSQTGEKQGAVVVMRDITAQKQAQKALLKSEERWQLALQGLEDGIFDWNIVTNQVFYSPQFKQMLGYEDSEMANNYEEWESRVHPDDLPQVLAVLNAYLERQQPHYVTEYRLRCKDGSNKWILSRGQAQWDEAGKALRMVGSNLDISDRKAAEAEIMRLNQELEQRVRQRTTQLEVANRFKDELLDREREVRSQVEVAREEIQLYQDIVENIQVGLCVFRLENLNDLGSFRLVATNPAATKILGVEIEDSIGQPLAECFPNALGTAYQVAIEVYAEVVRSGQAQDLGEVQYHDDRILGGIFEVKAFPLPNQCVGVAFEDLTERKRTEAALANSEHQYRSVVNSIKEIIFQTDTSGCWTFLNPAWTEITGFEVSESLYTLFTDYIYAEEDQQRCAMLFDSLMALEQEFYQHEFCLMTKSGSFRWLEIEAQVNVLPTGTVTGTSGTIIDTTERKQTEAVLQARADELAQINAMLLTTAAQLEKRNQELDQFAYVTSHDLKAPLRAIANLSEWIEEDIEEKLDEDTRHQMNLLRGRVHRMEALINGLLQYSRVGRIEEESATVAVSDLLEEVIDSLDPPPEFTIEVAAMPVLHTKRLPLLQVFSNLISNAIKHHHRSDGHVWLSAQDQGQAYEFTVADDGPGIAPEYQEKVFVIFQTLKARDKAENTGIGLSIVKKIIEAQGGSISVESRLGQGSVFRFTWLK